MTTSDIRIWNTPAALLGEGPVWSTADTALYWTDILGKQLHCLKLGPEQLVSWTMPERLGSFGFCTSGGMIGAFESGIALFDLDHIQPDWIIRPFELASGVRFNDGKV